MCVLSEGERLSCTVMISVTYSQWRSCELRVGLNNLIQRQKSRKRGVATLIDLTKKKKKQTKKKLLDLLKPDAPSDYTVLVQNRCISKWPFIQMWLGQLARLQNFPPWVVANPWPCHIPIFPLPFMCVLYLADALTHQVYLLPITGQAFFEGCLFLFLVLSVCGHPVCDAQSWLISIFKACWQLNTSVSQILSVENIYLDFIYLVWLARNEELLAILSQYWYLFEFCGLFVAV